MFPPARKFLPYPARPVVPFSTRTPQGALIVPQLRRSGPATVSLPRGCALGAEGPLDFSSRIVQGYAASSIIVALPRQRVRMRYLILSDLHANSTALEAALSAVAGRWEGVVCLGDVVGYGPDPNEVVDRVRALQAKTIRGNHDKAAC